jgi:fucose permease
MRVSPAKIGAGFIIPFKTNNFNNMNNKNNSLLVPMLLIGAMYGVLGFALGINAFFIPFVQEAFQISTSMSYLVMTATFSAFLVFGALSGEILKKAGYKGGMIIAFVLMALGFFIITPAAKTISFPMLLVALFISGLGQALLTGAVNTYISIIGPSESAAKRIALMGICNKTFYAMASLMLALFMDLTNVKIEDTILPFYIITGILLLMGFLYYFAPLPDIKVEGEAEEEGKEVFETNIYSKSKTSIFQFPHLILGVIAIFFVVGVEHLTLGSINDFATILNLPSPENYVWLVSITMIIGYLMGVIFIPKYVSQRQVLLISTITGIIINFGIILVPMNISIYLVAILGLANAMLWPAVWPIAIADLGKFTKVGSSLLVAGIIGGAILPLIFGYVAEKTSYQIAYLVYLPAYAYIIYYALSGSKIRTIKK